MKNPVLGADGSNGDCVRWNWCEVVGCISNYKVIYSPRLCCLANPPGNVGAYRILIPRGTLPVSPAMHGLAPPGHLSLPSKPNLHQELALRRYRIYIQERTGNPDDLHIRDDLLLNTSSGNTPSNRLYNAM